MRDPASGDNVGQWIVPLDKSNHASQRGAIKFDQAGETITVKWNGTTLGFSDIPQGKDMEVEVTIDKAESITVKRPQTDMRRRYARFFYLPE